MALRHQRVGRLVQQGKGRMPLIIHNQIKMRIQADNIENMSVYDAEDVFEIIQKIFYSKKEEVDLMKEHFWAFSLNKQHKILNIELVGIGTKDRVITDVGDIFRVPLYKSASYVIIAHNHPSGGLQPSEADIDITNRLMKAGDILDVKLIEHVIVTQTSYFSFQNNGLIEKLEFDTGYALSFIYEKKMKAKMAKLQAEVATQRKKGKLEGKKEGIEEGKGIGKKETKIEIAKQMLAKGEPQEKIEAYTGLSRQWIGRLKNALKESKAEKT